MPPLGAIRQGDAAQRQIVRLGRAGSENDLVGLAPQLDGNRAACGLYALGRLSTLRMAFR